MVQYDVYEGFRFPGLMLVVLCILWEVLRKHLNRSCASVGTLEMITLVADLVVVNAFKGP